MLIAFDQALNTTGYAVFNRKDGSLVAYDKFTTESADEEYKLREIRDKVLELIDKYKPTKIAIEEIQLQQIPGTTAHGNVETFKKLAHVQGVLYEVIAEKESGVGVPAYYEEIPFEVVPSVTWKSHCGIKGRARAEQKRNAQAFVLEHYGVKAIQDICDAICIGKYSLTDKKPVLDEGINWE